MENTSSFDYNVLLNSFGVITYPKVTMSSCTETKLIMENLNVSMCYYMSSISYTLFIIRCAVVGSYKTKCKTYVTKY